MSALPTHQVTPITSMIESYIRAGFALVPIFSGKGPTVLGWNSRENCITDVSKLDPNIGYGIAHAYGSPTTMALDIDDYARSEVLLRNIGIELSELANAPDSVMIDSGNPGHAKFLFQLPFGLTLTSKKIVEKIDGINKVIFELRCATGNGKTVQDILPSAVVHVKTQRPYRWAGNGHYSQLPTIPQTLLSYWESLIKTDSQRNLKVEGSPLSSSWEEIRAALNHIPADCSRDEWINCMMAIHFAGTQASQLDQALMVFDEWSATGGEKYRGIGDIMNSWRGLRPDGGITLGTLFKIAADNGWKRPFPDASELFAPVGNEVSPVELITSFHVPPPEPDFDLLPATLAARAIEVGSSVGCDPLVAAWAGLGAVCAAADARIRLEIHDGWKVPPVLWLVTIGNPADKKTPAARPMLGILKQIEIEDRPHFAAQKLMFEAMDAAYASAKKTYTQMASSPEFMLTGQDVGTLPPVPDEPKPPIPKRLTVSDITSQKLVRMCADRPNGLLAHLDEMKSWADRLSNASTGENRSTWTKAYECDTETLDRVGDGKSDGNVIADNFAVAIYGNMQPRVFKSHMRILSDDGFLQRFIPVILRDRMSDIKGTPIPTMFSCQSAYEQMIRRIHAIAPTTYQMSPEAYTQFRAFQDWYLMLKRDERILNADDIYMTALGKIEGTCGRLMLVWHLCDNPNSLYVAGDTARKAIQFVKTYVINSLRYVFGEVGGIHTDSIEHYVTEYVLQHATEVEMVTLSEIRRSAKARIGELPVMQQEQMIRDAMDMLEAVEWVKCVEAGKRSTQWIINPALAKQHATHRKRVIEAKQRRNDMVYVKTGGRSPHRVEAGLMRQ